MGGAQLSITPVPRDPTTHCCGLWGHLHPCVHSHIHIHENKIKELRFTLSREVAQVKALAITSDGSEFDLDPVLVRIFIAVKRETQRKHLIEVVAYSFRGSVHYHHVGKHGSVQAGRHGAGYILTWRQKEIHWLTGCVLNIYKTSKSTSTVTHFLQDRPRHSATPFGGCFLSNHHPSPEHTW